MVSFMLFPDFNNELFFLKWLPSKFWLAYFALLYFSVIKLLKYDCAFYICLQIIPVIVIKPVL